MIYVWTRERKKDYIIINIMLRVLKHVYIYIWGKNDDTYRVVDYAVVVAVDIVIYYCVTRTHSYAIVLYRIYVYSVYAQDFQMWTQKSFKQHHGGDSSKLRYLGKCVCVWRVKCSLLSSSPATSDDDVHCVWIGIILYYIFIYYCVCAHFLHKM